MKKKKKDKIILHFDFKNFCISQNLTIFYMLTNSDKKFCLYCLKETDINVKTGHCCNCKKDACKLFYEINPINPDEFFSLEGNKCLEYVLFDYNFHKRLNFDMQHLIDSYYAKSNVKSGWETLKKIIPGVNLDLYIKFYDL